ncbi:MAG: PEP-CTERM sorting domain-containing protein [Nitrosospira sp.]
MAYSKVGVDIDICHFRDDEKRSLFLSENKLCWISTDTYWGLVQKDIKMTGIRSLMATAMLAAANLFVFVTPAQATPMLIGETVTAMGATLWPGFGSTTMGSGNALHTITEYPVFHTDITVSNAMSLLNHSGDFLFAGWDDMITSLSTDSNTGFSASIIDNLSSDARNGTLGMTGVIGGANEVLAFNINDSITATPEPAPLALIGLGLMGLAYTQRKRTRNLT